ncbi:acetolactate synthase small subunit [Anaeromassilibacillus senegalensis]|uniref:Acetolactate synthase small subunit n=1 Tax=Anaeromassilibacillus senegalensis TaxID=1673717 RepID=A0ABS9CN56_9FIRM|nr:acetolactate synthase small subunit [Anaeromassilibacillus senegalensis]MCF2652225.1 acetolactate synthase small subunit [Anaeromassilibacillus senegalensis]MCI5651519.1 acetolactate synthase small subunit [Ruminococcus bromii]MDD7647649.1 acetolactate synthase small subunit [Ruminococcus bromii]
MNRYTLSVLVENQPGVLSKVVALFSRRGFNIHSLAVGPAQDETVSCITIVVNGDEHTVEQVEKQLNKIIPVIKVRNLGLPGEYVSCGLALIKVQYEPDKLESMMQLARLVGAEAVDIAPGLVTYKLAGETEKIENFLDMLRPYGIREIVRTGQIAIEKSGH